MFSKWRIALLGVVFFQGSNIMAMEKRMDSPLRNPLACSAELRNSAEMRKRIAAKLKSSVERRRKEKEEQPVTYYLYCSGGRGNSPHDLSPGFPYDYTTSGPYRSDCP